MGEPVGKSVGCFEGLLDGLEVGDLDGESVDATHVPGSVTDGPCLQLFPLPEQSSFEVHSLPDLEQRLGPGTVVEQSSWEVQVLDVPSHWQTEPWGHVKRVTHWLMLVSHVWLLDSHASPVLSQTPEMHLLYCIVLYCIVLCIVILFEAV